jgi:hypothetical protein
MGSDKPKRPSTETWLVLLIVLGLLVYVTLWTLYFLGYFPDVESSP